MDKSKMDPKELRLFEKSVVDRMYGMLSISQKYTLANKLLKHDGIIATKAVKYVPEELLEVAANEQ